MSFLKTNFVDIEVGGKIYNSLRDFGLAIENTDYIGEPVQNFSNIIFVPGNPRPLDLNEGVFEDADFQYRAISIRFGGMAPTTEWDKRISMIRNLFEGKKVKLYFWTEQDWYWTGRVRITEFEHKRALGTFLFEIPYADPFKYKDHVIEFTSTAAGVTLQFPSSRMKVYPTITTTGTVVVIQGENEITLYNAGDHKSADIYFDQCMNELTFKNAVDVTVSYSEGSL